MKNLLKKIISLYSKICFWFKIEYLVHKPNLDQKMSAIRLLPKRLSRWFTRFVRESGIAGFITFVSIFLKSYIFKKMITRGSLLWNLTFLFYKINIWWSDIKKHFFKKLLFEWFYPLCFKIELFFWDVPLWFLDLCGGFFLLLLLFFILYCLSFFVRLSYVFLLLLLLYILFLLFLLLIWIFFSFLHREFCFLFCFCSKMFLFGFKVFGLYGFFHRLFLVFFRWYFSSVSMPLMFLLKIIFTYERIFIYVFLCLFAVIFIFWKVPSFIGEGLDALY